jgi:hypothetical protein
LAAQSSFDGLAQMPWKLNCASEITFLEEMSVMCKASTVQSVNNIYESKRLPWGHGRFICCRTETFTQGGTLIGTCLITPTETCKDIIILDKFCTNIQFMAK